LPLQKYIHGFSGNWSRIPWDPRSTFWEPLVRRKCEWVNFVCKFGNNGVAVSTV